MNLSPIQRTIINEQVEGIAKNILNIPLTGFIINIVYVGDEKFKKEFIERKWYYFEKGVPLPVDRFYADILCRKRTRSAKRIYRIGTRKDIEELIASGKKIKHLVIRERGFGDLILLGPVLTKLSKLFPWWDIVIAVEGQYNFIPEHTEGIASVVSLTNLKHDVRGYPLQTSLSEFSEKHSLRKKIHRTKIYAMKFGITLEEHECIPKLLLNDKEKEEGKEVLKKANVNFERPIVGFELKSSRAERHWPLARTKILINNLLKDCNVVVVDGFKIDLKIDHPALINLTGKTNCGTVIKVISNCDVFFAWDSGLLHAAGALNIPTIALMGAINHELRTTYYPSVKVGTKKGTLERKGVCVGKVECYQCTNKTKDGTSACINFSVENTARAIRKLLKDNKKNNKEETSQ